MTAIFSTIKTVMIPLLMKKRCLSVKTTLVLSGNVNHAFRRFLESQPKKELSHSKKKKIRRANRLNVKTNYRISKAHPVHGKEAHRLRAGADYWLQRKKKAHLNAERIGLQKFL